MELLHLAPARTKSCDSLANDAAPGFFTQTWICATPSESVAAAVIEAAVAQLPVPRGLKAIVARLAAGWALKTGPRFRVAAADGVGATVVGDGVAILDWGGAGGVAAGACDGAGVAGSALAAGT